MPASKNLACGGLALLLCTTGAGCAGSRLSNMFSWNPTSEYKSIEELEAEAEKQTALRERALAAREPSDREAESEATGHALSGLFSRVLGRSQPKSDPFLDMENSAAPAASEEAHLAELERRLSEEKLALESLRKEQLATSATTAKRTTEARTVASSAAAANPFEESLSFDDVLGADTRASEGLFTEFAAADKKTADSDTNATAKQPAGTAVGRQSDYDVFAALNVGASNQQPGLESGTPRPSNAAHSTRSSIAQDPSANPADALQALLERSAPKGSRMEEPASKVAQPPLSADAIDDLDAFATRELARHPFDALTAAPLRAARSTASVDRSGAASASPANAAFDSLLITSGMSAGLNGQSARKNLQDSAYAAISTATRQSENRMQQAQRIDTTDRQTRASAGDLFAAVSNQKSSPLTDASGFNWKEVTDLSNPAALSSDSWSTGATGSAEFGNRSDRHFANSTGPYGLAGYDSTFAQQTPAANGSTSAQQNDLILPGLKPTVDGGSLQKTPGIQTASLSSSSVMASGFEQDPFFVEANAASGLPGAAAGLAQATDDRSVIRPVRFVSQLRGRTWTLLIGGIIVVALLFAPGRKKQTQV